MKGESMKKFNVLIADDEFLARKLLQEYVQKIESLNLVDSCSDGIKAMEALKNNKIDILLLDIQMPDLTGLELLKTIDNQPAVILTTAYSEYAVDAFSLGVVDYLLKPFDFPRFLQAINKAIDSRPREVAEPDTISPANDYIVVKADYKLYKVNICDILYIEGQHEYVTFHTKTKRITALYSLKNLEDMLPKNKFVRVQKSFIVAFDYIEDVEKTTITVAGNKIPLGSSFRDELIERLNGF